MRKAKRILESGMVVGRLTLIRPEVKKRKNGTTYGAWVCQCHCGKQIILGDAEVGKRKKHGCGCSRGLGTPRMPFGEVIKNQLVHRHKHNADLRGLAWELSDEQCKELLFKPCTYCGRTGVSTTRRTYKDRDDVLHHNGIDRVDNSLGYKASNCVPCCWDCNSAKKEMSVTQFFDWVNLIHAHLALKLAA